MDVLELLDALEVEVHSLRAEHAKLTAAFELAQQQLRDLLTESEGERAASSAAEAQRASKIRDPRRTKTRKAVRASGPKNETPEAKPAAKRRALGRTLSELRAARRRGSRLPGDSGVTENTSSDHATASSDRPSGAAS